jgi:apolipoprotein N-acyltransferase
MNWLWIKTKEGAWKIILLIVAALGLLVLLYNLVRPSEDRNRLLKEVQTNITSAIKENEIRATLEKDKIGAIKKIYDRKITETKKIEDREERLKALIRLHEELDL